MTSTIVRPHGAHGAHSGSNADPNEINLIHRQVEEKYAEFVNDTNVYLSPMSVSQVLLLLKRLRGSIDLFLDLPPSVQEERAYQLLNASKLIVHYSQPLIWFACGRYVLDTLMFTILSLEAVINLCTVRHINFRIKLYSTAFYAALSSNRIDEAANIHLRGANEVRNLWEREHLDPPIPAQNLATMTAAKDDLAVMKCILDAFRDPDSMEFVSEGSQRDGAVCEFVRIHLLGSGNKNETYMKRSQGFVKSIQKLLQASAISCAACLEVAYLLQFDTFLEADALWALLQGVAHTENDEHSQKLSLILQAHVLSKTPLDLVHPAANSALLEYMSTLRDTLYGEYAHRTRSILSYIAVDLYKKCIDKPLHEVLAADPQPAKLTHLADVLNILLQAFDGIIYYDPVFYVSVSLILANIYLTLKEYRLCIAVLKNLLPAVEQVRSFRTDFLINLPEDVRDILTLQHASITCRSTLNDWYDSQKRLAAYAYAGYGLFGIGNSGDYLDKALQDLHVDVYVLYFKSELQYFQTMQGMKDEKIAWRKAERAKAEGAKAVGSKTTTTSRSPIDAHTASSESKSDHKSVDSWSIVSQLIHYCNKNKYILALLHMEIAKLEREDLRDKHLHHALKAIQEAQATEQTLANAFADVKIKSNTYRCPLMLCRSSKYVYLVPVQCHTLKADSYRIYGKEKGSGTDVSVYNNLLPGCEMEITKIADITRASAELLQSGNTAQSLYSNIVKIGPLTPGEEYIFATAAFHKGKVIGNKLSPSTPVIVTLNPLNTNILLVLLLQTYLQCAVPQGDGFVHKLFHCIGKDFLLPAPANALHTLSNGSNLFLTPSHAIDYHRVHLISPEEGLLFMDAYCFYLENAFQAGGMGGSMTFNDSKNNELRLLTLCDHIYNLLQLANSTVHYAVYFRLIVLLNNVLQDLCRFSLAMGKYVQNVLLSAVISLQSVPVARWDTQIHLIYLRFHTMLVQLSTSISYTGPLVDKLYETDTIDVSVEVLEQLIALYLVIDQKLPALKGICKQIKTILSGTTGEFWQSTSLYRVGVMVGQEEEVLTGNALLSIVLEGNAAVYSDYLQVLLHVLRVNKNRSGQEAVLAVVKKLPIVTEYLSEDIQQLLSANGINTSISAADFLAIKAGAGNAAAAGGAKDAKGKGKADPKKDAPVVVEPVVNPYLTCTPEEAHKQRLYIAEILSMLTPSLPAGNVFIPSKDGPLHKVEANVFKQITGLAEPHPSVALAADRSSSLGSVLSNLCVSFLLYMQSNALSSACNVLMTLYNHITAEYVDVQMLFHSLSMHGLFHDVLMGSMALIASTVAVHDPANAVVTGGGCVSVDTFMLPLPVVPPYVMRDMQERLFTLIDVFLYFLQLDYLHQDVAQYMALVPKVLHVLYIYYTFCNAHIKRFSDIVFPYLLDIQQVIVHKYAGVHEVSQKELLDFVNLYNETQAKQRKKKLKINRLEKDDEEVAFDNQKALLEARIAEDCATWNVKKSELANIQHIDSCIHQQLNKFEVLLHKVRQQLHTGTDKVKQTYDKLISLLRENKEKMLLIYALNDISELMVKQQNYAALAVYVNDLIDGFFSIYNAIDNHRLITTNKVCEDPHLLGGVLYILIACGKYIKFVYNQPISYSKMTKYALFACELTKHLFVGSVTYPQNLCGFAAFECNLLHNASLLPAYCLNYFSLLESIKSCLDVTVYYNKQYIQALPLICLAEYIAKHCMHSAQAFLLFRLMRVYVLVQMQFSAEAISMLSRLPSALIAISKHDTDSMRSGPASGEVSASGLVFENCPVFINNQLPTAPVPVPVETKKDPKAPAPVAAAPTGNTNHAALEYIAGYPALFETLSSKFKVRIPEDKLSPEQRQAFNDAKAAQEAAAATAKKPAKGAKDAAPVAVNTDDLLPVMSAITHLDLCNVYYLCAMLLYKVYSLNCTAYLPATKDGQAYLTSSNTLLAKLKELLYGAVDQVGVDEFAENLLFPKGFDQQEEALPLSSAFVRQLFTDSAYLEIYSKMLTLEVDILLAKREYRQAMGLILQYLQVLQHPYMSRSMSFRKHFLLIVNYFQMKLSIVNIYIFQNKLEDANTLAEKLIQEGEGMANYLHSACAHYHLAQTHISLGELSVALKHVTEAIRLLQAHHVEGMLLLQAKCLKVKLLVSMSQYSTGAAQDSLMVNYLHAYLEMKDALYLAEQLAVLHNIPRPDSNLLMAVSGTAGAAASASSASTSAGASRKNAIWSPTTHMFTELHNSDPNPHRDWEDGMWCLQQSAGLRLGPVDLTDPLLEANVVNVYSAMSRLYLTVHLQLLCLLKEIYSSKVYLQWQAHSEQMTAIYQEALTTNAGNKFNYSIYHRQKPQLDRYVDTVFDLLDDEGNVILSDEKVLKDMLIMAEQTTKVLRVVAYVPPYLRVQALYCTGYARIQHALSTAKTDANGPSGPQVPVDVLLAPLLAALHHASVSQGGYMYLLLRDTAVLIADTLAQPTLHISYPASRVYNAEMDTMFQAWSDGGQRMKAIIFYLQTAMRWHAMYMQVYSQTVSITESPLSAELDRILTMCYNASISPKLVDASVPVVAAKDAKGKAKETKAPAAAAALSTRDALLLLTGLLRQADFLPSNLATLYNTEHSLAYDLHLLLLEDANYKNNFTLQAMPLATTANVVVPVNSISTIWQLQANAKPDKWGLYGNAECILVLGDVVMATAAPAAPAKGKPAAGAPVVDTSASNEPAMKKVCLRREHLQALMKMIRDLTAVVQRAEAQSQALDSLTVNMYGKIVLNVYHLLRFNDLKYASLDGQEADLFQYSAADNKLTVPLDKYNLKCTLSSKQLSLLADTFTTDRSVLNSGDAEVCYLLRIALGCAKFVKGATGTGLV